MRFFENQERARRRSALLVLLYALAVLGIVAAVNVLVAIIYRWNTLQAAVPLHVYVLTSLAALGIIVSATLIQVARLSRGGGDAVARMAGARRVAADTTDPLERRLLNVSEEMAIASGLRVPNVYVMDAEEGINAFAAGYDASHAVIAVTRGALTQLNRDELQGVIAHEFSHILNGDMRLNIRMLGVLAGIVFIGAIGRFMLYGAARARRRGAGGLVFLGAGLFAVGAIGLLVSQIIKAAISRQREFLADAASVQFTRNPEAIAGALDQIRLAGAGSRVGNRYAEDMSHMYFAKSAPALFATHPSIDERITRAHPEFDAEAYRASRAQARPAPQVTPPQPPKRPFANTPEALLALIGVLEEGKLTLAHRLVEAIPQDLRHRIEEPQNAAAFVVALMLSEEPQAQLDAVRKAASGRLADAGAQLAPHAGRLPRGLRLPAIDLALAALKGASVEAKRELVAGLQAAIHADARVSLHEFIVWMLVRDQLADAPQSPQGREKLEALRTHADVLVSLLSGKLDTRPSLQRLTDALQALKTLAPLEKPRLMKELAAAATADGSLELLEAELLRLVGAVLDCPLPPLHDELPEDKKIGL